jgi:uncharacterized repeat protein (TIGR01451 family)
MLAARAEPRDPPAPQVTLRVRVPAQARPGEELKYRLLVDNPSQAAAHHVIVRDRLPANAQFLRATPEPKRQGQDLLWELGTLAPRAQKEIIVEVRPDGSGDVESQAFVQFEYGQVVRTRLVRPNLRLRVIAPSAVKRYETLTLRLEVTNTGPVSVADVVLTDTLPAEWRFLTSRPSTRGDNPLTWKLATLAPGQSRMVEFDVATPEIGKFRDQAEVTAAGGVRQRGYAEVEIGEPKLSVVQTGPARRAVGRPATYKITVRNDSTLPLAGVQIVEAVPREVTFRQADGAGQLVGDQVRWLLGTLKPGERRTVQVEMQANLAGRLRNIVQVSADGVAPQRTESVTDFEAASRPMIEIDKGDDPLEVGRRSVCRVRVYHPGPGEVKNLGLTVSVLDNLQIVAARGFTEGRIEGTVVRFDPLPALTANMTAEYTLELQAVKPGPSKVRGDLLTAPGTLPLTWEEPLTVEPRP